ncbi:MAG: prepilin-type N-terminal cleavage/methylation domain-containing protein [Polyangiaceae bacterium]
MARQHTRIAGFSLLEVMVAIAILGLTLTVILSAQGGLAASNRAASNIGTAVTLGRCKMTEVEEKMLKFGFPELDANDTEQPCCDEEAREGFSCDIKVEKVMLPNMQSGNSLGDGGALVGANGSDPGSSGGLGGLGALASGQGLSLDGGLQGIGSQLQGQVGGGGAAGLVSMVMGIVYPSIKPMYEASIRRVTVAVKWKEGPNVREFALTQFLTQPQRSGFVGGVTGADGGALDFSGTPGLSGSSGSSGTGTSPTPTSPTTGIGR